MVIIQKINCSLIVIHGMVNLPKNIDDWTIGTITDILHEGYFETNTLEFKVKSTRYFRPSLKEYVPMTMINTPALSDQQIADYHDNGYLIVRNVLSRHEAIELRHIVQKQVECDPYPPSLKYPQPAKYTISGNKMAEASTTSIAIASSPGPQVTTVCRPRVSAR